MVKTSQNQSVKKKETPEEWALLDPKMVDMKEE